MTSSVTSLVDYLKYLHLFGETFELHTKKSTSVTVEIPQAIKRLDHVYSFFGGTTAATQGPQGTVSSVVMEDERRILKSLGNIKDLLDRFNPSLTIKFIIKSLLTSSTRSIAIVRVQRRTFVDNSSQTDDPSPV